MAQTNQPIGSSPLANMMQQGQVWRGGPVPPTGVQPANLGSLGGALGNMAGATGMPPATGTPMSPAAMANMQAQWSQMARQAPQTGDQIAKMQQNLSAIQGMQPNQIPRMPGMQPPPGAPGQGPGGAKAPGTPGGAQQMKQQMARLPGGPPPGAPAAGPGGGKAPGRPTPQMRQQIAQLPGAPAR